jgi:hypothetical protein
MKELSEEEIGKITAIKKVVCDYYDFPIELLDNKSRKNNIPLIKQIVCLLAIQHFKTLKKYKLALYFNTNHANILIGVKKLKSILADNKSFSREILDIENILDANGIIGRNYSIKESLQYYDLNNFISVKNSDRFILFKGYSKDEVQDIVSKSNINANEFDITEHNETKHFIFTKKS